MTIEVLRPGPLTTLQDLGRYGYQRYGVVVGGAMDEASHRFANMLVGNREDEATLELTLQGPSLDFHDQSLIALCGGDMAPRADGVPLPLDRPVLLRAGTRVELGTCKRGCRAYLAVRGGFDVPVVMGSRSTFVRAALGGFQGRPLRKGDFLRLRRAQDAFLPSLEALLREREGPFVAARWGLRGLAWAPRDDEPVVRVIAGRHWDRYTRAVQKAFVDTLWRVSPSSDRMGYRLAGDPLQPRRPIEPISEPIAFGSIQVPHDGHPIVLMADRQTTGGYARIAEVASVDLPRVAQLRPGDRVRFQLVDVTEAQRLRAVREQFWAALRDAIRQRGGH